MAKKATPATAIHTASPLEACKLVVDTFIPIYKQTATNIMWTIVERAQKELGQEAISLPRLAGLMRRLNVPRSIQEKALTGQIACPEDVQIAIITARMIGD